jgi:hypothetical protein
MMNQPASDRPEQQYFLPGQTLLLIEYPDALSNFDLARLLDQFNQGNGVQLHEPYHVLHCPPFGRHGPFSLVSTTFGQIDAHPAALIEQIDRLNRDVREQDGALDKPTLRIASPNWLAGGTSPMSWGGPAGRPVAFKGKAKEAAAFHPFNIVDDLALRRPQPRRGAGVEVVLLDTAPSAYQLARAYWKWQADHPLVQSLLQPGGRLRVSYAAHTEFIHLADYDFPKHPYNMADHGLFSAGIVHSIAPQAALHLVEVLHPYGAGDVDTIVRALWRIAFRPSRQPLVINMSLGVNIPQPDYLQAMGANGLNWKQLDEDLSHRMCWPLQWVCDVLRAQGVLLVAAAGNDADGSDYHPYTRYPAAFDSVLGVGALTADDRPAPYSNRADVAYSSDAGMPASTYAAAYSSASAYSAGVGKANGQPLPQGVATFGGDVQDGQTRTKQGVLGIYTGTLPEGNNRHGWAWWAGTSFAAPIVSGTLAALLSENANPLAALQALEHITQTNPPTAIGPMFQVQQR